MKFGKNKQPTLQIKDIHGIVREIEDPRTQRILSIVRNRSEDDSDKLVGKPEILVPKKKGLKLYLNRIIKLLFNNKANSPLKQPFREKVWSKLVNFFRREQVNDIIDLAKFVIIHGCLGSSIVLTTLTILGVDIPFIQVIRNSLLLSLMVYSFGTGSLYYIFLDAGKAVKETWRPRSK